MNLPSTKDITELEDRLTEVLQNEQGGNWVNVSKIELSYILCDQDDDKPIVTIEIRYGYQSDSEPNWQKELELYYEEDSLDFIAGQFFQALVDEENKE